MSARSRRRRRQGLLRAVDRRWLVRIVGLGAGAFLLGYLLTWLLFFRASDRPPVVTVPDLRTLAPEAADRRLEELGLELTVGDSLPNSGVPAGGILTQSPLPGREVAPGSQVRVILSAGAERRTVPVVSALGPGQAERLLAASGFQVEVERVPDPRAPGRVVGVEPSPGTTVQLPARVRLLVSAGPPLVGVPDLAGLSPAEAEAALQAAGLRLGEVEHVFAGIQAEERVRSQDPAPGDSIRQGQAVRVWVATDRLPGTIIR